MGLDMVTGVKAMKPNEIEDEDLYGSLITDQDWKDFDDFVATRRVRLGVTDQMMEFEQALKEFAATRLMESDESYGAWS